MAHFKKCAIIIRMKTHTEHIEVTLGRQGRLVIPATLRKLLGLSPGSAMVLRMEDDRLILEKPEVIWARVEKRFATVPKTVSLADELISERREAANQENGA